MRLGCKEQPELSRGIPRLHTSFILFINLASPAESGETCAAAPSSRPSTELQLWSQTVVWRQLLPLPIPGLCLLQSDRHSPPSWDAGDSRLCDLQGEPQAVGLLTHSRTLDKSSGEAGPSTSTVLTGPPMCALSPLQPTCPPPGARRMPLRHPLYLRTLHFSEEISVFPYVMLAMVTSQPHLPWDYEVRVSLKHPMARALRGG